MPDEKIEIPDWLDEEFLRTCIKKSQGMDSDSNVKVKDKTLSYVVPKGENYMSVMYRATVKYQLETEQVSEESFVVKVAHVDHHLGKTLLTFFDMETDMFVNVVPQMEKILGDKGLTTNFTCRHFKSTDNPKLIVLEDVKPLGFVVADRHTGMDLEHCKHAYSKIAKFHAAGMCYFYSKTDEFKSKYSQSGFEVSTEGDENLRHLQKAAIRSNIKELEKHNNRYKKAISFFTKYSDLLNKCKFPVAKYKPGCKFNSINHGDFWVNNMMYKYNQNGSIAEMILVDLQVCQYNTVASDFLFFFLTSTTLELRKNNYEELREFYFNSLISNLKQLDYKGEIPTMKEFEDELKRNTNIGIFALIFMLPAILAKMDKREASREKSEVSAVDDIIKMLARTHQSRNYLDKMVASVSVLQDNGFMDIAPEFLY